MPLPSESRIANGTINPMTFLMSGAVAGGGAPQAGVLTALQATGAGVPLVGLAQEWAKAMMGTHTQTQFVPGGYPAAYANDPVGVYGELERSMVVVGSGYTVEPDTLLVADASGYAIPYNPTASSVQWIGARALEAGLPGQPIRCVVLCYPYGKAS